MTHLDISMVITILIIEQISIPKISLPMKFIIEIFPFVDISIWEYFNTSFFVIRWKHPFEVAFRKLLI